MLDLVLKNNFSPISENREFAEFIAQRHESPDTVDEMDWMRFVHFAYGTFGIWEHAYISHQRGLIDDEIWTAWDLAAKSIFVNNGYRKFWSQERTAHSPNFRAYIDQNVFVEEHERGPGPVN